MTVKGPISPDALGVTMCHTHVLSDGTCLFAMPEEASRRALAEAPVTLQNLGAVRRDALANKDNLVHGDVDAAVRELARYQMMGGDSVVEASARGFGRDPVGLFKVSNATGLNIVCCTGFYIGASHPPVVAQSSQSELSTTMVNELTKGIGTTGIRAGVIKIAMGTSGRVAFANENEEKAFRAAVHAHAETGAPIEIHPARPYTNKHWDTYFDIIEEAGGRLEKVMALHMEFYAQDIEYQKSLLDRGVTASYDQFGGEEYFTSRDDAYPPDRLRVDAVCALAEAGYAERVVLSNEVAWKCNYTEYGGHGYGHVLENIVPEFRSKGMRETDIWTMLVENPKRMFPF
jgi:phosphotriesterase-related protein